MSSTSWSIRTGNGTEANASSVQREGYAYLVPFVEEKEQVVLKTIIPSRKATRKYLGEETADGDA